MRGLVSESKMRRDREDTRHPPLASACTCTWKYTPAHTCADTITHTNTMWYKHVPHKTHHSKMCNFVVLVYLLCHLAITTNFRIFSSPWKNYQLVKVILILIPCTTTNLTSVSMVFLVLEFAMNSIQCMFFYALPLSSGIMFSRFIYIVAYCKTPLLLMTK